MLEVVAGKNEQDATKGSWKTERKCAEEKSQQNDRWAQIEGKSWS